MGTNGGINAARLWEAFRAQLSPGHPRARKIAAHRARTKILRAHIQFYAAADSGATCGGNHAPIRPMVSGRAH